MKELEQQILELEKISTKLEPPESQRNRYLQMIQDYTNSFINNIEETKTYSARKVKKNLLSFKEGKKTLKWLIKTYAEEVADKGIRASSGGHLGYIPGGGIYTSALADYLAAITNEYAGLYFASPGAVTIENEILNWMKSIFKFPEDAAGTLTSGGSIANLIALTAARDHHKIKSDLISKSVIYLSPQAHHCINKALKIIGLEDIILRYSVLDKQSRIDARKLKGQIDDDRKGGLNPFMIIGSAGTTDTGAVDPLMALGKIASENKMWYHVDGAYGGFFILTQQKREILSGIELADSLVTDPHKGLFIPYGTGAVLVKNKNAVTHSHQYTANYMQDSTQDISDIYEPANVSPELTRHFRALRIWLPLQMHGIEPFVACLEEKLLLTAYFRDRLLEIGFMTGPEPDLSVSYFWYPARAVDEDLFNRRLLNIIHQDGNVFFSSTLIEGKFVIRMAILSFRTRLRTINKAIGILNDARITLENELNR